MIFLSLDYHYIEKEDGYPNGGIYPVSPERFSSQLEEIGKHFEFISQEQILRSLDKNYKLPEKCCIITFDDGLKCQYENALPILIKKGIPAIFFVNSAPIVEKKVCLVHKIHWVRANLPTDDFDDKVNKKVLFYFKKRMSDILDQKSKKDARKKYRYDNQKEAELKFFLNNILNQNQREKIINEIFEEIVGDEEKFSENFYINSLQIKDLHKRGFLGLHSYSHKNLGILRKKEIYQDLKNNKKHLEDLVSDKIYSISYPFGSKYDINEEIIDACKELDIKFGFTKERAFNKSLENPLLLARADTNDVMGGKNPQFEIISDKLIITGNFDAKRKMFVKE